MPKRGRKMQTSTKHRERDLAKKIQFLWRLAFISCEVKEAMARLCPADQCKMDSYKGSEMDKIIKIKSKKKE